MHSIRRFAVPALFLALAAGGCADSKNGPETVENAARAKSTFTHPSHQNDLAEKAPKSTFRHSPGEGAAREKIPKSTFIRDRVKRLSDGDSMILRNLGRVRLVGVDCPELHQEGGREASRFTRSKIHNKTVEIEICREDPEDMYGRKLVFLYYTDAAGNRQMLNTMLLRHGYARVYENTPCLTGKRDQWKADYEWARRQRRGLFATEGEVPDGKIYRRRHPR